MQKILSDFWQFLELLVQYILGDVFHFLGFLFIFSILIDSLVRVIRYFSNKNK